VPSGNLVSAALAELITIVMKVGRKCPAAQGDILELMLLVSQIEAYAGIDHGYRHGKHVIARLRHPMWSELTPEDREVLNQAADAIERACKLEATEAFSELGSPPDSAPSPEILRGSLEAAVGDELSPPQIARVVATVQALLRGRREAGIQD
jgi:hypothetical protein